jgi:hypothetical protein
MPFDGLAHDQVVRPADEEAGLRSAILEYRFCTEMEKSDEAMTFPEKKRGNEDSETPCEDIVADTLEERKGLGRLAVPFPDPAMEAAKGAQRYRGIIESDI